MENTHQNTPEATDATDAPNLTAQQAAEIIISAHTSSMVEHITQAIPFRLVPKNSAGGHFNLTFTEEGGMNLDVDKLAVESRVKDLQPNRTDFMILMGTFLIQQAEAALRTVQVEHLASQLEELEKSGALKLGPTVSPELIQMLAGMQNQASEVTDGELAKRDAANSAEDTL